MSVNWSLLQPVDIGGMFQQGWEKGQQIVEKERLKSALAAFSQNPMDPNAQSALAQASPQYAYKLASDKQELAMKAAERARLGAYFSEADPQAARKQALAAGDIDVAQELSKLSDEQRKQAAEEAKSIAPAAYQALKLPYEQRRAYLQSIAPQLNAVGFDNDEIAAFDPSDASLNGIIQTVQTLEQARSQDEWKYVTRQDGSQYAVDSFGRPIGDPTGGSGGGASQPPAPAGVAPGSLEFTPVQGAHPTSSYRTPEDNKRVGGVANSFHMQRGADGQGMARDFVPPPGMSMGELHAKLSAANPHLQVINEGDHVHIEPRGHPGRQAALPTNPIARAEKIRADAHAAMAAAQRSASSPEEANKAIEAIVARAAKMGVSL